MRKNRINGQSIENMLQSLRLKYEAFPDGVFGLAIETENYFDDDLCEKILWIIIAIDEDDGQLHVVAPTCYPKIIGSEFAAVAMQGILSIDGGEVRFQFDKEHLALQCRTAISFSVKFDESDLLAMIRGVVGLVDENWEFIERAYLLGTLHQSAVHPKELADLIPDDFKKRRICEMT